MRIQPGLLVLPVLLYPLGCMDATSEMGQTLPSNSSVAVMDAAAPQGSQAPPTASSGTTGADASSPRFDPQLPPSQPGEIAAWLAAGYYKDWVCEETPTTKLDGAAAIHVHGAKSRICANVLLAALPELSGGMEFPKGVAAVKEVFDAQDALLGRFVEVKVSDKSEHGSGWYWYKDAAGVAEGLGLEACTGCHSASASDADHPGAGDFVYFRKTDPTQIPTIGDTNSVQQWLKMKYYAAWQCEPKPTTKTAGGQATHVHGTNRVCSNSLLAAPGVETSWPAGVAAVKELFDDEGRQTGTALYLKVKSESADGAGWYWYESPSVEGFGNAACVGCHGAAGSDVEHPGSDFVYFRNELHK